MTVIAFTKPTVDNELPASVPTIEYVQPDGSGVFPGVRDVARITHDGRFALVKGWGRGSYILVVRTADGETYRHVGRAWSRSRIDEVVVEAGQIVGELGDRDPFVVELPGEAAPLLRQVVELRCTFRNGQGHLDRVEYWRGQGRAYEAALDGLAEGLAAHQQRALKHVVEQRAELKVNGEGSYVHAGWDVVFTSPEPSLDYLIQEAHGEAVEVVLKARANRAEWASTLRAERVELEAEFRAATERELESARERLERAEKLAKLALHSVDDAAQQLLDQGGSGLRIGSARSAHRLAEELARVDRELELVENAPVPNTVLETDSDIVQLQAAQA